MSLTMSDLMATDNDVEISSDSNKRKFIDTELITKRCKSESPTVTSFTDEEQNSEILSDITDGETSDASTDTTSNHSTVRENHEQHTRNESHESNEPILNPQYGQLVNRREFRRAGPYIIGLKIGHSPVDSIVQYLAKKENTNTFVQLKILMLNNDTDTEKQMLDERQGKMLLHTEFSLLSMLKNEPGVVQQHGMFSDTALEEVSADSFSNNNFYTGNTRKRLVLVLDCVTPHDFDPCSSAFTNLQQYLISRRKLTEMEAIKIFYETVTVVENLHKRNIIHRDLKLGNIVLNKYTSKVTITNFCLGKYLLNENDLLYDQRGSPAYISPDVLSGKPYKGKPSDMWALGVVLFMMLYRQFPFFESTPTALFKKIKAAEYFIPLNCDVSKDAEQIIRGLLQLNPEKRLTATQVRERLKLIIDSNARMQDIDRVVPQMDMSDEIVPSVFNRGKWTTKLSDANDQVVPTMSEPNTSIPSSRKRRRSTEQILSEMTQRGISIEPIDTSASDEWKQSDVFKIKKFFEENRRHFEAPSPVVSSQPIQSFPRIISLSNLNTTNDRTSNIFSLIGPNTLRIVPRNRTSETGVENCNRNDRILLQPTNQSLVHLIAAQNLNRSQRQQPQQQQQQQLQQQQHHQQQMNLPSIARSLPNSLQISRQLNGNNASNNRNGIINVQQLLASSNTSPSNNRIQSFPQLYRHMMLTRRQQLQNRIYPPDEIRQALRRIRRGRLSINDTNNNNHLNQTGR